MKNLFFIISLFFSMNVVGQDAEKKEFLVNSETNEKIEFTEFRDKMRAELKSIQPPSSTVIESATKIINEYKATKTVDSNDQELSSKLDYIRNNHIAHAFSSIGLQYQSMGNVQKAKESFNLALENNELIKKYDDEIYYSSKLIFLKNIGIINYKLGNFTKSIEHLDKYLNIWKSKKLKYYILEYSAINPLVNSLRWSNKNKRALEVLKFYLDVEMERSKNNFNHYALVGSDLARIALAVDPELAIEYVLKGLEYIGKMDEELNDLRLGANQYLYQTSAYGKMALSDFISAEKDIILSNGYEKKLVDLGKKTIVTPIYVRTIAELVNSIDPKNNKAIVEIYKHYLNQEMKLNPTDYFHLAWINQIIGFNLSYYDSILAIDYYNKGLEYAKIIQNENKLTLAKIRTLYRLRSAAHFKNNEDKQAEKDLLNSIVYLKIAESKGYFDDLHYSFIIYNLFANGKYNQIKKLMPKALEYQKKHFGEAHINYLNLLKYNRWTSGELGASYEDQIELIMDEVNLIKKYKVENSEDLYFTYTEIIDYYFFINNMTMASVYAKEAAEITSNNDDINILTKLEAQSKHAKYASHTVEELEIKKAAKKYLELYNTLNSKQLNSIDKNQHIRLLANYIESFIRTGNYADVNKYFNQLNSWILENDDVNPGYKLILTRLQANMLQAVGNFHDSRMLLEKALEKWEGGEEFFDEDYNNCLLILGIATAEIGDEKEAKKYINKFLEDFKKNSDTYTKGILESLDIMLNTYLDMRSGDLTRNANKYIKNFDKTINNLENTIDLTPFYMVQGLLLYENKKYRSAEKIMKSVYRKQKGAKDRNYAMELGSLDILIGINKNLKRDNTELAIEKIDTLSKLSADLYNFGSDTELLEAKSLLDPYRNLLNTTDPQILFDISLKYKDMIFDKVVFNAKYLRNTKDNELRQLKEKLENFNTRSTINGLSFVQNNSKTKTNDMLGKRELEIKIKQRLKTLGINIPYNDTSNKDIQNVLFENQCLIEYFSYSDNFTRPNAKTDKTYCAFFIIKGKPPEIIELGSKKEIDGLITNYLTGKTTKSTSYDVLLNKLYNRLLGKIDLDQSDNKINQIYLSLDGQINLVNFNVLLTNKGEFLTEKYRLIRIQNSRSLLNKKEHLKPKLNTITLITDVDYDKETVDFNKESLNYRVRTENLTRGSMPALKKYVYLPGAKKEAKLITDNLPSNVKYFNYSRSDADEDKIYSLKNTDILHFATHGFFKDINKNVMRINPLATCGIALNGANRTLRQLNTGINMNNHKNDGLLTGIEITSLDLEKTQLVTLSMCDSGLGRVYDGESINGLKKAFYMAGAKNIITTLWPISDNYTATFMNDFYQELFKNGDVKDAFHVTQKQHLIKLKKQFTKSKNGIHQTVRLVGPFILN